MAGKTLGPVGCAEESPAAGDGRGNTVQAREILGEGLEGDWFEWDVLGSESGSRVHSSGAPPVPSTEDVTDDVGEPRGGGGMV